LIGTAISVCVNWKRLSTGSADETVAALAPNSHTNNSLPIGVGSFLKIKRVAQ
jgi:hypothetical protein